MSDDYRRRARVTPAGLVDFAMLEHFHSLNHRAYLENFESILLKGLQHQQHCPAGFLRDANNG